MVVHPSCVDTKAVRCICFSGAFVTYSGRSPHASVSPELGGNALDAVVTPYQAVAQLRPHIKATERLLGIIINGGAAPNMLPDRAAATRSARSGRVACGAETSRCTSQPWDRSLQPTRLLGQPPRDNVAAS
jgi:metal-dependent amidase/aminoacylase/carboxypeptidase family protein